MSSWQSLVLDCPGEAGALCFLAEYSLEQGIIDLTNQQPEFQEPSSGFWYESWDIWIPQTHQAI